MKNRNLLETIRHSQFYKEQLKETPTIRWILRRRNQLFFLKEKLLGIVRPEKRVDRLSDAIQTGKLDSYFNKTRGKYAVLYITNDWGGGSENYLQKACDSHREQGNNVYILRYSKGKYALYLCFEGETRKYYLQSVGELLKYSSTIFLDEIVINQLTLYPNLLGTLKQIEQMKETYGAKLTMLVHDYYALCPSFTLTSVEGKFCRDAKGESCNQCFQKWKFDELTGCRDVTQWRKAWDSLLSKCDEIRCFSNDTLQRVQTIYGTEKTYTLIPHKVDYLRPIRKDKKTSQFLNIGILGALNTHKGAEAVQSILHVIRERNLAIRIVLIGFLDGVRIKADSHFVCTGKYKIQDLPRLIVENDIDLFFIPSIWPETFSYTTEEVVKMDMPLVTYNIGAPAERVSQYEKGLVINLDETPEVVIEKMISFQKRCTTINNGSMIER